MTAVTTRDNAALLTACGSGEPAAWDEMVGRFSRLISTVTGSYRLSPADAEDVHQLTWLRLVQNVDRIRDPGRLGDWLATVAAREAMKAASRTASRSRLVVPVGDVADLDALAGHSPGPEQLVLAAQLTEEVERAVAGLTCRCRDLLRRTLADPRPSYEQISAALDLSVGSVGPIRTRCLRRLRTALAA